MKKLFTFFLALATSVGMMFANQVWPIIMDETTFLTCNSNSNVIDFRPNDEDRFLYIWSNNDTYSMREASGVNSMGNTDGYLSLSVTNQGWSGAGLCLTEKGDRWKSAEQLRAEIVSNPDNYYLHMAIKSTDNFSHCFYLFGAETTKFVLGKNSVYDGPVYSDFTRDGEWQEFYIPMVHFAPALENVKCEEGVNIFVLLSEGVQGAMLNLDAVFICDEEFMNTYSNMHHITAQDIVQIDDLYYKLNATNQTAEVFAKQAAGGLIQINDNSIDDWNTLPAQYVSKATYPADAAMTGLKSVKVYADAKYINVLVEPNMEDLFDLEWVPFHIYLNTDNSDNTGGYGNLFTDANIDILLEGALYSNNNPCSYTPAVFKWWGEVGGNGWEWTDPSMSHDASDCWGAIVCEGQLRECNSQYVNGKFEIQINRTLIPANWNNTAFGIGVEIQQNWSAVGFLPCVSPTNDNPSGLAAKLQVTIYNTPDIEISGNVVIPETVSDNGVIYTVTSIGENAFTGCNGLTSVTIPNSVINIGSNAFSGCTGLTKITIPTSVNAIGNNAFMGCDNITSVVWNAKNCNRYKFGAQVESFVFGNEVEIIPAGICSGMNKLPTMTIPNSVTSIGDQAFSRCSGLTSMKIGNSVTSIGYYAFEGCSGLTSMTIPNSVTSIGDWAFDGCSGLTSITIPKSVTSIGDVPFLLCSNLKTIDIDADNPNYSSERGVLFNKDKTTLIQCPGGKQGTFAIPNAVTSIGNYAFSACSDLTSVTIPNSVTNIGDVAFSGCSSLTSIEIPNSVTNIGESAFVGCAGLTSVVIGNGVKEIRDGAFIYCPLKSITIGTGLRKISSNAFLNIEMNAYDKYGQPEPKWDATGNFIYTVEKVVCYAKVPPTIELSGASDYKGFLDNFAEAVIYVPQESVSRYQAYTETWGRLDIRPIKAESVTTDNLVITPSETSADIVWPAVTGAATYELVIKDKQGNIICTLVFNAQGQLTSIAFSAPARGDAPQQTQGSGFSFTVTGLDSGSSYDLTMASKDENGDTIDEKQLSFSTSGNAPTAIYAIEGPMHGGSSKLLRNGQVLIRRGDKLYTMQGQEVE